SRDAARPQRADPAVEPRTMSLIAPRLDLGDETVPFRVRTALAMCATVYAYARFGFAVGGHAAIFAAAVMAFDLLQRLERVRHHSLGRGVLIALQVAVVYGFFFAPSPIGYGSVVPAPIFLESPLAFALLALLASHLSGRQPGLALWAGGAT